MTFILSRRTSARPLLALTLALCSTASSAQGASAPTATSEAECNKLASRSDRMECEVPRMQTRTIFLRNVSSQNDANEIMVSVRNLLDPNVKIYLVAEQNALVIRTFPEELERAEAIVHALDLPHKAYRLAYTITELDGDKTVSTQHMSMVAVIGQHTSVKEGDKVPLATGSYSSPGATTALGMQTQFTYIDVGMNFDATIEQQGEGVSLKSKVEQSSVGPSNTIAGVAEPVIRQTVLDGFAILTLNKPVMLGSIDVPTTTRRFDIAVVLEAIK